MAEADWVRKSVQQADLPQVAQELIHWGNTYAVWLFQGDLGAGKTTFIKALGNQWQVEDRMSSPTFSIVNEYLTADGQVVYHFDFYRIEDESEALDIGIDEYFDSGNRCLIEWAEKIPNLLPVQHLQVNLEVLPNQSRTIYASKHE